jgi:hypothetical protein
MGYRASHRFGRPSEGDALGMSRYALARRLLVVLAPALVGCGAEGDGSRSPITTVGSPAQVETQDFRDFDADHEDEDDDESDNGHGKEKGNGKGKGQGQAARYTRRRTTSVSSGCDRTGAREREPGLKLRVHDEDGEIQERLSFENDPEWC